MKLKTFNWKTFFALLLAAFFLVGSLGNILASEQIVAEYARWGYPSWFHYVTGTLELTAAVLLAIRQWRLWGGLLGAVIMVAASLTTLLHGEIAHALAPLMVLSICTAVGWLNRPQPANVRTEPLMPST